MSVDRWSTTFDEPDGEESDDMTKTRMLVMDKVQDAKWVQRLLAREEEIEKARRPVRTPDQSKAMEKVSSVYGSLLTDMLQPFPAEAKESLKFHDSVEIALEMQSRCAEVVRRQCDDNGVDAIDLDT